MKPNCPAALAVAVLAAGLLGGCDRDTTAKADREGAAVARKVDAALERTRVQLAEAGKKTEEKLAVAGDKTQQALDRAGEKTRATLDQAGRDVSNTTAEHGEEHSATGSTAIDAGSARQALSDTAITASIKTDFLKDPDLSVLKIDVDTKEGVVTLNGLAANDEARQRAERIAQGVKGVKQVRNFLVTKKA
jgi:hyperosmotically inducible periplasmic protein